MIVITLIVALFFSKLSIFCSEDPSKRVVLIFEPLVRQCKLEAIPLPERFDENTVTTEWECNCGNYRTMKHLGEICKKCGVESRVHRYVSKQILGPSAFMYENNEQENKENTVSINPGIPHLIEHYQTMGDNLPLQRSIDIREREVERIPTLHSPSWRFADFRSGKNHNYFDKDGKHKPFLFADMDGFYGFLGFEPKTYWRGHKTEEKLFTESLPPWVVRTLEYEKEHEKDIPQGNTSKQYLPICCAIYKKLTHAKDEQGNTLLHHASCFKKCGVVDFLLKNGAEYSARNNHGLCPVHYIDDEKMLDICFEIHGEKIFFIKSTQGKTLFDYISEKLEHMRSAQQCNEEKLHEYETLVEKIEMLMID